MNKTEDATKNNAKISVRVNVKKLPKSEVEIEGEIGIDAFEAYFDKALKKIGENLEIDGFRKGKVPDNVLLSKIPESRILTEMAELALSEHYPKILEENKIDVVSRPEISITKLARKNPLGFKIKTAMMPAIELPDYKKIAKEIISERRKEKKEINVTEKEIEETIMDIRKSRAPKVGMAEEPHPNPLRTKEGEGKIENKIESELPEFNDEFVQALGPFRDVNDFKEKLKENIRLEKENQAKEEARLKIVEKIIADLKIELPEILVEMELNKILYRMESDITEMGLKFEDYLKHLNKTEEDLKKEFRTDAEKKAKLSLVINEIAKNEKIIADREQVAKEIAMILERYKDADPERAQMHAENILTNEKVFEFLESQ